MSVRSLALVAIAGLMLALSLEAQVTRSDGAVSLYQPTGTASAQNPAFSPDGRTLLFTIFTDGYNGGSAGIYLLDMAGDSLPRTLLFAFDQTAVNLPGSSWNRRFDRIVFSSDREDRDEIWTISPDGSDLFRVTNGIAGDPAIEPSFSPDGERVVFETRQFQPDTIPGVLRTVRSDGSAEERLFSTAMDDREPNWAPSGNRIVFQRRLPGSEDWDLFTVSPDGSALRPLVTGDGSDTDASWSPDGRWVVFASDRTGGEHIFVVSADGGAPIPVTSDTRYLDSAPSWSVDGDSIVFESHTSDASPSAIWKINSPVNGRAIRRRPVRR